MYKNETILTPFFRYIISCIDESGDGDYESVSEAIKNFYGDSFATVPDLDQAFLQRVIELLERIHKEENSSKLFWEEQYRQIEGEMCNKCVACRNCKAYFWLELGEIFFKNPNPKKLLGEYLPVRRIPIQIGRRLAPAKKTTDLYYFNYCRKKSKVIDGGIVLKGMSSSTPSLMNSIYDTNQYSGGGFYLRHNGIGVAIDPGYHFIDNLHHYGLSVLDIDAVVITHEHIDHNNDMRLLDDLHHAVCRCGSEGTKRTIDWYFDKVSYEVARIYQENETGFDKAVNLLHCISVESEKGESGMQCSEEIPICENENFRLKCFQTRHIENKTQKSVSKYKEHTFGCQFRMVKGLESRYLVYTSDTSYFPEMIDGIEMPDVLIANISGVYEDDFMLVKPKERHLGYYGCHHLLVDIWNRYQRLPDLVMLSEFWNGENDIRYDVASCLEKQIKQECGTDALRVVPAEVGMVFQMTDGSIRCSQCGRFTKNYLIRKPNGYKEKIRVLCDACVY